MQSRTSCGKQNGLINLIYGDVNDVPGAGGGPEARKETVVLKRMLWTVCAWWPGADPNLVWFTNYTTTTHYSVLKLPKIINTHSHTHTHAVTHALSLGFHMRSSGSVFVGGCR